MPDSVSRRELRCRHCARHFSSPSHLRRHEATHSSERPAVCTFCDRRFVRTDVLLRHSKTCKQKDDRPLGAVTRGRKRKACDTCALGRVACDGDSPCETCLFKGLDCLYSRVEQLQATSQGTHDQGASESHPPDHISHQSCVETRQRSHRRISISFLLNCPHNFHRLLAEQHEDDLFGPTSPSGQFTETWPFLFHAFINPSALDTTFQHSGLLYGLDDYLSLSKTSDELFRCLDQAPLTCALDIESYRTRTRAFVSETNIMRFVNAFFQYAYCSNPFIHKACFNVNTASRYLVLAVLLFGLTYASRENTSDYNDYFDVVEFLIFEGPEVQQLLRREEHPVISKEIIQLIQAAILMIELQGSHSNVEIKRRTRFQRLPTLILVVRLLNLTKVVNDIVLDGHVTTLEEYLHKETLVRLTAWIYLLDAHCVIFYHSPSQLRLFEAGFGLPMHDAIFDAVNPAEANVIVKKTSQAAPLTLRSVVQRLMDDKPVDLEGEELQIDSLFGLFLILSALHCVLFDLQALASIINTPENLKPVERALDRWKLIWDSKYTEHHLSSMGPSGFMVHALEFWWLAKKLVKHPEIFSMRDEVAADSTEAFHEMVKSLETAQSD